MQQVHAIFSKQLAIVAHDMLVTTALVIKAFFGVSKVHMLICTACVSVPNISQLSSLASTAD